MIPKENIRHKITGLSYIDAGVDLQKSADIKRVIADIVKPTLAKQTVVAGPGGFSGVISPFENSPYLLVASTDGVGTKTKIARIAREHQFIGYDIVNHCVNDILCTGATPLFFLDYIGTSAPEKDLIVTLVSSMSDACVQANCAIIGGETATMPDIYAPGDYDIVGFIVGILQHNRVRKPNAIKPDDVVFGIPSNGLHTNGYSLVRKIFELDVSDKALNTIVPNDGRSLSQALLEPHLSYLKQMENYINDRPHPIAHITGGGLQENILRVLPPNTQVCIDTNSWSVPPIFRYIQQTGNVSTKEMFKVFNMGIGLVGFLPKGANPANIVENAFTIGSVSKSSKGSSVELCGI